jgi:hypothetical protein
MQFSFYYLSKFTYYIETKMPTVFLLDNSLSMYKKLNQNGLNHRQIALNIIKNQLKKLTQKENFEYVSIVSKS